MRLFNAFHNAVYADPQAATESEAAVRARMIARVYDDAPMLLNASLGVSLIVAALTTSVADPAWLAAWLALQALVALGRYGLVLAYRRHPDRDECPRWARRHVAGSFAAGLSWGLLALLVDSGWPLPQSTGSPESMGCDPAELAVL